jgi:sugar phosphate permease
MSMAARDIKLILFGFLLALASSFGQTFFIALFGGQIRAEFGLSHGAFGSLYSLATLLSGLLMLWVGAALDRVSLLGYAAAATALLAAACLVLAATDAAVLLVLALFGLRLAGQGMMSHASLTGMARAFTHHRGKAIAVATLGHPVGEAVLPIVAVSAAAAVGWRSVGLGAAALLVLVLPVLFGLLGGAREAPPVKGGPAVGTAARSYSRAEMLRDRRFHRMVPALVGPSFIVTGLLFHQVHLSEVKGWDLAWFATCFAAYATSSTAALVLSGTLIDRLGAVRLMPVYLLPLALGCAVLAFGRHDLVALGFMGLAGLTSGAAATVVTAMWAEVYGIGHLGAIRALAASLSVVASALAPAFMGWLIDAGVSMETIALGAALYLVGATFSVASASLRRLAPSSA